MGEKRIKVGLTFPPEKVDKPVVTNLVKYNLSFNILKAYISPGNMGTMMMELKGSDEDFDRSLAYLEQEGVQVKVCTDSVIHDEKKCINCGACTAVCPSGALQMNKVTWVLEFDMDACLLCGHCVHACPARAIKSFDDTVL